MHSYENISSVLGSGLDLDARPLCASAPPPGKKFMTFMCWETVMIYEFLLITYIFSR